MVESNNTLIVDGPASVRLVSGKVEVFGTQIRELKRILVREGKRLPFFVDEKAIFDISLGVNATIDEVAGRSTIPLSWNKPVEAILSYQKKPVVILILGRIDSGKSSYCTYLVNNGVPQTRLAYMPGAGEVVVPENNWFLWPNYAISGGHREVAEATLSAILLQRATVAQEQFIGTPYRRWFGRRQVEP